MNTRSFGAGLPSIRVEAPVGQHGEPVLAERRGKIVAADGVALAFIDHQLLRRTDHAGELVGKFQRRQFIVFAGLDQNRAFDVAGDRREAEFLDETIEFVFVGVARHIHEAHFVRRR